MKKCNHCQQVKDLTEFSKVANGKYGAVCKVCAAEKQRQWYEENKDRISVERSVNHLTRSLNLLRRKASNIGYKISVVEEDGFLIQMEKIK